VIFATITIIVSEMNWLDKSDKLLITAKDSHLGVRRMRRNSGGIVDSLRAVPA
jgi:hypothetical protein